MMRIAHHAFGDDRILGYRKQMEIDLPERSEIQEYLWLKNGGEKKLEKRKRAKDMNPNGYFEMAFCCGGIRYLPAYEDVLNDDLNGAERKVVKVVSQGLALSDPKHVDKIVFMLRDPRAVAKSQERLGRPDPMNPEDAPVKDGKKILVCSPQMFNRVNVQAAMWITRNPEIPVHVVEYDNLLDNPKEVIAGVHDFLGEGDFTGAEKLIDPDLRRSEPKDLEGEQAEFAMLVYEKIKVGDFEGVKAMAEEKREHLKKHPPKKRRWFCPRLNEPVAVEVCEMCHTHKQTRNNLRDNAIRKKINWEVEPCPYECGIRGDEGISVQESVAGNHWLAPGA
jgi:hypothetical protein